MYYKCTVPPKYGTHLEESMYLGTVFQQLKGSVQRKLKPMLLYIIQKLFTRRLSAEHLNFLSNGDVHYALSSWVDFLKAQVLARC